MQKESFYATLPKKRMAAGALFFNVAGEVLIVKPTYREGWLVPGGVVEERESPSAACVREVREELGLDIMPGQLLCIEYQSGEAERTESLQFIFFGGTLCTEQIAAIRIPLNEIAEYRFVDCQEALVKLTPRLAQRVSFALCALNQGRTIYAENGVAMA